MDTTLEPMVALVRLLRTNAKSPIFVTESGIVTELELVSAKAAGLISVTGRPLTVDGISNLLGQAEAQPVMDRFPSSRSEYVHTPSVLACVANKTST